VELAFERKRTNEDEESRYTVNMHSNSRDYGELWLQADLLDRQALEAQGLGAGSLNGVLEHTCFCAIDPAQRDAYLAQLHHLLKPNGWLLGLFWCHRRQGGPPYGSDPQQLHQQLSVPDLYQSCGSKPRDHCRAERMNGWHFGGAPHELIAGRPAGRTAD
jgi:thiopurine S-methyltransferase